MQKISVSGPAELVTIVPFHLGFQPERSVVIICLQEKSVGLVARMDVLAHPQAAQAAAALMEPIERAGATAVALVAYEDEPGEARPLADALGVALGLAGIPVVEDLVVRGARWYCLRSDGCPDDGGLLPAPADVPAVAGYVAQGRSVLGSRRAVASLVEPLPEAHDDHVAQAVEEWRHSYRRARHSRFLSWIGGPAEGVDESTSSGEGVAAPDRRPAASRWEELTDESLGAWGVLLRGEAPAAGLARLLPPLVGPLEDRDLRDALIGWLCPGWLPTDEVDDRLLTRLHALVGEVDHGFVPEADDLVCDPRRVEDALLELCRVTPVRFAAPVLTIAGAYAWCRGDGTRAGLCVDRALQLDPEYRLARLIRVGLDHGVRMPAA
ncbi:DUF4192 domain-containing protein [Intrasporangium sp. DVR]|uniref:DUF4192 domain-containing protein n=1 Tax=Intrasporangium sp. DVR TaxID=3127867 RepID=UPI0033422045